MDKTIKNIVPVIILLLVYTVPFFFDNRLLNVNTIHRFLFSSLTLVLAVTLMFYRIKYFTIPRFNFLLSFILLFLLFVFVSSSVGNRFALSLENILLYINIFIFSYLIFLVFQLYEFEELIYYVSFAVSFICLLVAVFGILEYYDINILGFRLNSRPGSTLNIRNFAAEYSIIALPYLLITGLRKQNIFLKYYSLISGFIILVFIFFCRTRSSFIAVAVYLIVLFTFIFYNKSYFEQNLKKYFFVILTLLVISVLTGSLTTPNMDKSRTSLNNTVASMFDKNLPENSARINYTKTALRIFRDEPLLGIGGGSWFGVYPIYNGTLYNDENILVTSELNPHNDYLEILSENGIFGFIFFISIILLTGKNLFVESRKKIIYLPVFLSFVGFAAISMFSFPKSNISAIILFATSIGISLTNKEYEAKSEYIKLSPKTIKLVVLSSLSVILLAIAAIGLIRYNSEINYIEALKDKSTGNYKSMLEKFETINTTVFPADANCMPVEFYRGVGYFELQKYNEALTSFNEALELTPNVPSILSNKASAYYMLKENDNAIKLLTDMKIRYPFFMEPQINLLAIYTNLKRDSIAELLIKDIGKKCADPQFIKNYSVFEKISAYYNEKNSN